MAGLAAVAALPLQESAAPTQDDLLKILHGADPKDNDLMEHTDRFPESPIKTGEQELHEETAKEDPQQQIELQDPSQEQTLPDSPENQQETQPEESPEEQQEAEQQSPPQEQIQPQPQPQVQEVEPAQESPHSDGTEDESPVEESVLDAADVRPEPQPILVDLQKDISIGPGDLEGEEATYFGHEMEGLPIEPEDDYVVIHMEDETPFEDMEGTFVYGHLSENAPFDQGAEPLSFSSDELSPEPQMPSIPFEPEPQMQPFSEQLQPQMDSVSYDSGAPLNPEEELSHDPETESDYEQLPLEGSDDEYDNEFPVEYQPEREENMWSEPESDTVEDAYYADHPDVPVDLLSWLVPDFFDEDLAEYEEPHSDSSYYDHAPEIEDHLLNNPEALFEPQVSDDGNWEEPSVSETDDATDFMEDFNPGNEDDVIIEAVPLGMTDSGEREDTDDVSLVDFFIPYDDPVYSSVPQDYSSDVNNEEEDEHFVSPDTESFPVDDGLVVEPFLNIDVVEFEQDEPSLGEVLSENNPSEDSRYNVPWPTESDMTGKREIPEEDESVTILETQPVHFLDEESDLSYPSLLAILERDIAAAGPPKPWNNAKSLMTDFSPEADTVVDDSLTIEQEYPTEDSDDGTMDIIMINDPREGFDNFLDTSLEGDSQDTPRQPTPMAWYPEERRQPLYWQPRRRSDRLVPRVYYSVIDESPWRMFSGFFENTNDLTPSPLPNRPRETYVTADPFSFMNELPDEMPPKFLPSISRSGQHRFRGLDSPFSARNYPDMFTTPRLSFRDLIRGMTPDYQNTMHVNNIQRQRSMNYPQAFNPSMQYNVLPQQYSRTSQPLSYSSLFDLFEDDNNMGQDNYYPNRLERLSSYKSNNLPSGIFREDTMSMFSRGPQRYYEDYDSDLPFMSSSSYSSPRSLFPNYDRPRYEDNSPSFNRPRYSQNSYYHTGPYHPTPIYSRYAPEYY